MSTSLPQTAPARIVLELVRDLLGVLAEPPTRDRDRGTVAGEVVAELLALVDEVRTPSEVARAESLRSRFVQGVNHVARCREIGEDASPSAFTIASGILDVDERAEFLLGVVVGLEDEAQS